MRTAIPSLMLLTGLLLGVSRPALAGVIAPLPAAVRAGEVVELRWSNLAPDVEEVEFELSLDGGRWLRISPERAAADGAYRWRVPRQACRAARVRLRVGGEGFERALEPSAPFAIVVGVDPANGLGDPDDVWETFAMAHARHGHLGSDPARITLAIALPPIVAPESPTLPAPFLAGARSVSPVTTHSLGTQATSAPAVPPFRALRN